MSPIRKKNLMALSGVTFGGKSDYQSWMFAAAGLCLLLIATQAPIGGDSEVADTPQQIQTEERPEPQFASVSDVQARKEAFFNYFLPYMDSANGEALRDRAETLRLEQHFRRYGELNGSRLARLNALRAAYGLEAVASASDWAFETLLVRADTVPASLALSQAAIESAWGTSRFAQEGNNLFGMWCYKPGCGIVPRKRPAGRTYEVAAYPTPEESFRAYLRNLNTNASYEDLREIRYAHRSNGVEPSGYDLAAGLVRYSQERWVYVEKVRSVIARSGLELAR